MKGPDFPTGGIVVNKDELRRIYETGTGKIKLRGSVEVEKLKGGKEQLVITEIPYTMIGANIGKFLNDVAALVETKKTTGHCGYFQPVLQGGHPYCTGTEKGCGCSRTLPICSIRKTRLEDTFGVNMLASCRRQTGDSGPEADHRAIMWTFQFEVTTRKYKTLLGKELEKQEIQEGLIKACDVIDLIIEILRGSKNRSR